MYKMFNLVLVFTVIFGTTECAKILGIFHIPGPSHYMAGKTLMKILASQGHEVTFVSPYKDKNPPKNFREVVLDELDIKMKEMKIDMFKRPTNPWLQIIIFHYVSLGMIENVFNHTKFQEFMSSKQEFDAVIVEQFQSESLKYIANHFNAPLILFNAMDANDWVHVYQGNPDSPAYIPSLYLPEASCEMSFFERVENSLIYVYYHTFRYFFALPSHDALLHRYYPNAPPIEELSYNVSLALINADASVQEAIPKVPSMVNIGGFHIKPAKELPEDLRKILDNAKNGVIYFSLGSNLKSKEMPVEKRKILMNTFAKLEETILWKFEDDNFPGKPGNVIIRKWFPQNDILAHKNVKLFITHGGIFSSMESVYHGVPIFALPVFGDQSMNAKRATNNGYARYIPFAEFNDEDTFLSDLREMLNNPKYKNNAMERSTIMKDKLASPADTLNYWVEYVIRHKGAKHLRVASVKLAWYQSILLDVVLFLVVTIYAATYLFRLAFRYCVLSKKSDAKVKVQ